ncbi:hypothetical protein CYMTET_19524 [Cymbomonas tetramitiformis]|uniref:Uncharacterized protein n=1 Tax=Cymbomonas tetramitiformis TaxID=36881 RepID=A0AAE0G6F0_9CHLO|nr:hypothetical protein CYMTET_19524 [Cymbomonas tetramitiformis]
MERGYLKEGVKLDLDKLKDVLNKRPLQMNENCRKEAETSAAFSSNTLRSDTLWESPTNLELVCCPKDEVEAMLSEIADLLRHPLSDVDKVTEDEDFLKSKSSERHLQRKSVAEFLVQAGVLVQAESELKENLKKIEEKQRRLVFLLHAFRRQNFD